MLKQKSDVVMYASFFTCAVRPPSSGGAPVLFLACKIGGCCVTIMVEYTRKGKQVLVFSDAKKHINTAHGIYSRRRLVGERAARVLQAVRRVRDVAERAGAQGPRGVAVQNHGRLRQEIKFYYGSPLEENNIERLSFWPRHKGHFFLLYYPACVTVVKSYSAMKMERTNSAAGHINGRCDFQNSLKGVCTPAKKEVEPVEGRVSVAGAAARAAGCRLADAV